MIQYPIIIASPLYWHLKVNVIIQLYVFNFLIIN
jgi:hypothetical protein